MKEYEVAIKFLNGCAGAAYPQISFDEACLENTDDYVRAKHGKEFDQFVKEEFPGGRTVYTMNCGVVYIYEFTEL